MMKSILLKIAAVLAGFVLLVFVAGVSGFTFYVWPTFLGDKVLDISPVVLSQLNSLKVERKFEFDKSSLYFGAPNELARASAQAAVDSVIVSLMQELPRSPQRAVVLGVFKEALAEFKTLESEERDQFLVYLERIMSIVGVKDSGELFNVWRYGFPYGWVFSA